MSMPEALEASTGIGVVHLFCTVGEGTDRQAITAAGTGCAAAQDAQHYLSHLAPATVSEPVLEVSV